MEILVWILSYLLLSYFIMGLVVIFNPELFDRFEGNEKVWGWVLSPVLLLTWVLLMLIYGAVWLCTGESL